MEQIVEYNELTVKERVISDMTGLGVYKTEYDAIINIYCDLLIQYYEAMEKFELDGRQYETSTAAGGSKKSAIVSTLETLRKDILAYSDRLCLNPKSVETVTKDSPKQSKLSQVLSGL